MKKYFIVGASSGIGKAISNKLHQGGNYIYGTYNKSKVNENEENIKYHHLDVLDDNLDMNFLPDRLDGLVYCPGNINLKMFTRIDPEQFLEDYKLQLVGAVKIIQSVIDKLKRTNGASIVLFSTVAVQVGFPFHTLISSSKGAIEGLTKALAAELAPNMRVNCIAPSLTNTKLASSLLNTEEKKEANAKRHPLKKIGEPEDIAEMATFLLSEKSKWITGQILHVDGGISKLKV